MKRLPQRARNFATHESGDTRNFVVGQAIPSTALLPRWKHVAPPPVTFLSPTQATVSDAVMSRFCRRRICPRVVG